MDSEALRLFVEVVDKGSFSAAARHHGLAPSSVTRRIESLERALGARLLNRSTRRLQLTEAGQLALEQGRRLIEEIEELRDAVTGLQTDPRGLLRVTAPFAFGRVHLAAAMPEFLTRYEGIRVELTTTDQVVDLLAEGIDVAVRIGVLSDSSLVARRLASLTRVICASPAYLARRGIPGEPSELARHECLTFRFNASGSLWRPGSDRWRLSGPDGELEVSVGGRLRTNNPESLLAAARAGLGLVLMPRWMVSGDLAAGTLVPVLESWSVGASNAQEAIYAVYPSARGLPPKARVFVDFLVERFGGLEF